MELSQEGVSYGAVPLIFTVEAYSWISYIPGMTDKISQGTESFSNASNLIAIALVAEYDPN